MTEPQVYELLTRIFREVFERGDIVLRPELTSKDVFGWDSFKQVEILMQIEDDLGITLSSREIDSLRNVGDLAKVVLGHTAARAADRGR